MTSVPQTTTSGRIRVAFSPDSDDIFMFWPLLAGKVDAEGLTFDVERADTESLNARAAKGDLDVCAVSVARWPSIAATYQLLPHGMSVGRGYGPVVVSRDTRLVAAPERLRGARIGVPGLRTTAYFVARLVLPEFVPTVVPITPYSFAFDALRAGTVDAVLLIHEGRLTYEREGLSCVCDLGDLWAKATSGLPIPLGANVIRRALGASTIARLSRLIGASIAWSLAHREEAMAALLGAETRSDLNLDRSLVDRYLAMYANEDSRTLQPDVRRAIDELYIRSHARGLLDQVVTADFAP